MIKEEKTIRRLGTLALNPAKYSSHTSRQRERSEGAQYEISAMQVGPDTAITVPSLEGARETGKSPRACRGSAHTGIL